MTAPVDRVRDALDWVKSDATPAEILAIVQKALKPEEPQHNYSIVRAGSSIYVRVDNDDEPWRRVLGDYYSWDEVCQMSYEGGPVVVDKGDELL